MRLNGRRRTALALMVCAAVSCMPDASELAEQQSAADLAEDADLEADDLGSQTAALRGNSSHCLDGDVLRWEFSYPNQYHGNMQVFSDSLPAAQRDYWARTDNCPALVVDWVRQGGPGSNVDEVFVTGITDPRLSSNPQDCALLWVSKKIVARYWASSYDFTWDVLVDKDEVMGQDCAYSFNGILWLGTVGNYRGWFSQQARIRAITQGFYYTFPVPVSSYMQTDSSAPGHTSCPTQCCYEGWANPYCAS